MHAMVVQQLLVLSILGAAAQRLIPGARTRVGESPILTNEDARRVERFLRPLNGRDPTGQGMSQP